VKSWFVTHDNIGLRPELAVIDGIEQQPGRCDVSFGLERVQIRH